MFTKQQIGAGIIGIVIVVLLIVIFKKESFVDKENETNIKENFPATVAMNVLYSDASGNLSSTSDLGVQNLTTMSDAQVKGALSASSISTTGTLAIPSYTDVKATLNDLYSQINSLKTEIASLKTRTSTNETDITSLKTRTSTNETDITSLKTRTTTNETDITSLKTSVTSLNSSTIKASDKINIVAPQKGNSTGGRLGSCGGAPCGCGATATFGACDNTRTYMTIERATDW